MKGVGLASIARVSLLLRIIEWVVYLCRRYLPPLWSKVVQLFKLALPWLLAIGLGLWLANAIQTVPAATIIATVIGLLSSVILIVRPEYSVILLLTLTATIIGTTAIPKPLTFSGQGFAATELLIVFMLPVLWVRIHSDRKRLYPRSPMTLPMIMMCTAVVLSIVVTFEQHISTPSGPFPFKLVYNGVRPVFHYLFFFVVVFALDTKEKLRLVLRFVTWAAFIVAVMMIVQYFLGTSHWIFIGTSELAQDYNKAEIARPLAPGRALVLLMFVVAVGASTYRSQRSNMLNTVVAVVLGIGIIFTNTRGDWISSFVSVMVIWMVINRAAKWRLGKALVICSIVAILLSIAIGRLAPGAAGREFLNSLEERFVSIFKSETIQSSSLDNRIRENDYAIRKIKENPIFGIGAGNPVGIYYWTDPKGNYYIHPKYKMHNGYLELYMVYGLLGIGSFLWLSIAFFLRGVYIYKRISDPQAKALILSLMAAYVGYMMRYFHTMALLHEVFNITTVCFIWGLIEVVWRLQQQDSDRQLLTSTGPAAGCQRPKTSYKGTFYSGVRF